LNGSLFQKEEIMKFDRKILFVIFLALSGSGLLFGQSANDYRSAASGDWSAPATWERYSGSQWEAATVAPDSSVGAISIQSGHIVTVTAELGIDSARVLEGGQLVINPGVTVTVAYNNDGMGIDVDSLGSVTVNGTIVCQGNVGGTTGGIVFADGSVYDHARNSGSVPRAVWETGSTIRLSGVTGQSPSNMSQDFYNLVIDCSAMTANLNMGMTGNTIHGDITVLNTGPQRYYLTAPNAYVDPITIMGNIFVYGGTFSSNGSSSQASIIVHTYGNVIVTAGNFGCSRGSGTSVSWYLYGDSMSVSNATLQNSTSSAERIQKFIFAKQGTQYLRWSNVTYGSNNQSPITVQVGGGTTLDIGTTHMPADNSGSFILDSGATLVTYHNAPGDEGSIECLADWGGGNNFININATSGSGNASVKAFKGPHPQIYDTSKTLQRYWTVVADPGITEATLTFYYYDLDPVGTEVRGDETQYKALRYAGVGTDWYTITGSSVDDVLDYVTAPGITTVSGDWTVGEPAPAVSVKSPDVTAIPKSFFVDQNYPNPFNPSTTIVYGLPQEASVTIRVYNLLGQEVATLFEGKQSAGVHQVKFDAGSLGSGVYMYRVQAGSTGTIKRMILMK
jgi:hypothetical protein